MDLSFLPLVLCFICFKSSLNELCQAFVFGRSEIVVPVIAIAKEA